jgi:lipopolysaccharide export system protein LptA
MFCHPSKKHVTLIYLFIVLTIALNSSLVYAADNKKAQTLHIQSQYLLLDEKKGISTYKGNVLLQKDTLVIKADAMTLYYIGEKLDKVIILGSPADVRHAPDNEAKVHSQANKMEYLINQDKLTLSGQAFVTQGNRHFSGETIEYDARQRIISAAGNQNTVTNNNDTSAAPAENQRVHVIIGPDAGNDDTVSSDSEN